MDIDFLLFPKWSILLPECGHHQFVDYSASEFFQTAVEK
jgi:hypothetical protein